MIRSAASKVMWVGRATVFPVGLAMILALVFGVATSAMGTNGQAFVLGKLKNAATKATGLVGNVDGSAMRVTNTNAGADDTALDLRVQAGEAPMRVNSGARVANLNAATAGRADSAASADNADKLDGVDSAAFWRGNIYTRTKGVSGPANSTTIATHSCDSGDKLLSGGYAMSGTGFDVFVDTVSINQYFLYWNSGATATSNSVHKLRRLLADSTCDP